MTTFCYTSKVLGDSLDGASIESRSLVFADVQGLSLKPVFARQLRKDVQQKLSTRVQTRFVIFFENDTLDSAGRVSNHDASQDSLNQDPR